MRICVAFLLLCSIANAQPRDDGLKRSWAARERWLARLQAESDLAAEDRARRERQEEIDAYRRAPDDGDFFNFDDISHGKIPVTSGSRDLIKIKNLKEKLANPRGRLSAAERRSLQAEIKEEMKKPSAAKAKAEKQRRKKEAIAKIAELEAAPLKVKKVDVTSNLRRDLTRWPALDMEDVDVGDIGLLPPYPVGELTYEQRDTMERASQALERGEEYPRQWRSLPMFRFVSKHAIHGRHNVKIIHRSLTDSSRSRRCIQSNHPLFRTSSFGYETFRPRMLPMAQRFA